MLAVCVAFNLTHACLGWSGCFGSFIKPKFRVTLHLLQGAGEGVKEQVKSKHSGAWFPQRITLRLAINLRKTQL